MQKVERIPQISAVKRERNWQTLALDTLLAVAGTLIITGIIYSAGLYPTIPNIAIVYLLIIVALAIGRGSYAAILAAFVASLSFDFFLIPPLYTLSIARWQEWVALLLFLLTAIMISQLAAQVRRGAEHARFRERQARILYELMRVTNDAETLDEQLDIIVLSLIRVFAHWGMRSCALLLPDKNGTLTLHADAPIKIDEFSLTRTEMQTAETTLERAETTELVATTGDGTLLIRMYPLKTKTRVLGVLCLRVQPGPAWNKLVDDTLDSSLSEFFRTFLDHATSLVERALLRQQAIAREGENPTAAQL